MQAERNKHASEMRAMRAQLESVSAELLRTRSELQHATVQVCCRCRDVAELNSNQAEKLSSQNTEMAEMTEKIQLLQQQLSAEKVTASGQDLQGASKYVIAALQQQVCQNNNIRWSE